MSASSADVGAAVDAGVELAFGFCVGVVTCVDLAFGFSVGVGAAGLGAVGAVGAGFELAKTTI